MVIHKVESVERKANQPFVMVWDCNHHWCRLNNKYYQSYNDIMNIKTRKYSEDHECYVTTLYHINLNKW